MADITKPPAKPMNVIASDMPADCHGVNGVAALDCREHIHVVGADDGQIGLLARRQRSDQMIEPERLCSIDGGPFQGAPRIDGMASWRPMAERVQFAHCRLALMQKRMAQRL